MPVVVDNGSQYLCLEVLYSFSRMTKSDYGIYCVDQGGGAFCSRVCGIYSLITGFSTEVLIIKCDELPFSLI